MSSEGNFSLDLFMPPSPGAVERERNTRANAGLGASRRIMVRLPGVLYHVAGHI